MTFLDFQAIVYERVKSAGLTHNDALAFSEIASGQYIKGVRTIIFRAFKTEEEILVFVFKVTS